MLNINISDHLATFLVKKKSREEKKPKKFQGRDYSKLTSESVEEILLNSDQESQSHNPNDIWSDLDKKFTAVSDTLCPVRDFVIKNDRPVYFTTELSNLIQTRDNLYKKARAITNRDERKKIWKKALKKRNEVRTKLRTLKRAHVMTTFEENKKKPKKYWKAMNSFLHKGKRDEPIKEILVNDSKKISGREAADVINQYFCRVGSDFASKIIPTDKIFAQDRVNCKFRWGFPITEAEVYREILALSNNKSSGIRHLNCRILKLCLQNCRLEFTQLLNSCVTQGIFPAKWKEAVVVPIPMGGKAMTLSNIRPISLLPTPGKILERFMHHRIYLYLMENNLFSSKQTGLRKHFGIHDATIDLVNFIHLGFNKRNHVLCIFVDMAKAFNSLDVNIHLSKLERLGFEGQFLELLKSY